MTDNAFRCLTNAANRISDACQLLEQGGYDNPSLEKLHKATAALHHKLFSAWEKEVAARRKARGEK